MSRLSMLIALADEVVIDKLARTMICKCIAVVCTVQDGANQTAEICEINTVISPSLSTVGARGST